MKRSKTFFEILGVSRRATDKQVQQRWLEQVAEAHGEDQVGKEVRYAYRVLAAAPLRNQYRELLDACRSKTLVLVPPEKVAGLRKICRVAKVLAIQDPADPAWFHFRLPHQSLPKLGTIGAPATPRRTFFAIIVDVLTFQIFRAKSAKDKFFLALLYLLVIFAGAVATRWASDVVRAEWARSLEAEIRSLHAKAEDEHRALVHECEQFVWDFQTATTVSLDDSDPTHRPRDLDLALIRHESVRTAWGSIHAIGLGPGRPDRSTDLLVATETHIHALTFLSEDRKYLVELLAAIREERRTISRGRQWLNHIRRMVAADRFETAQIP
jgi:hypothetical protein